MAFTACPGQPWHGQEDFVLFGTTVIDSNEPPTPKELSDGRYVQPLSKSTFSALHPAQPV